ncbi:MAG: thioredoxin domain-containing protein [Verrucomicrobiota bacterium]
MTVRLSLLCFSILLLTPGMALAEGPKRKPIPPAAALKKLPPDGGPEYNRLVFEKSPYLLQHAGNPVDWYPWGKEAFAKAKKEDKPVFLSVGYATCHWCHVMEHESFEDPEVAKMLNESFICIKVDREERPDVDQVYMTVTQALNQGRGGWPMTVVMDPDQKPFFAGTYFPKDQFQSISTQILKLWKDDRKKLIQSADSITEGLKGIVQGTSGGALGKEILDQAFKSMRSNYDQAWGGFGKGPQFTGPKFPSPHDYMFLLRYWKRTGNAEALEIVENTLTKMRIGGVYDHVGFGLHRYATDREWFLPHFEKMLYDQALITLLSLEAYQATGKAAYREFAEEVLTYVLRDMTAPEGGFYSAEDAESEGEEGKFYLWSAKEVDQILGEKDGPFFRKAMGFTEEGNYYEEATGERPGTNIPFLNKSLPEKAKELGLDPAILKARLESSRKKLFAVREKRSRPIKDDKVLTDWNGLMIAAMARASVVLGEKKYADAAEKAVAFVLKELRDDKGRLKKRYRDGESGLTGHLEDYAYMVWGLLETYEATFDATHLSEALALNELILKHFWDEEGKGFFMTADDAEALIVRGKDVQDGARPSGNSTCALNLIRLSRFTGNMDFEKRAIEVMGAFSGDIKQNQGNGFSVMLMAVDFLVGPSKEIVIAGEQNDPLAVEMLNAVRKRFEPNKVVLFHDKANSKALSAMAGYVEAQTMADGKATAYVCRNRVCDLPTHKVSDMIASLERD